MEAQFPFAAVFLACCSAAPATPEATAPQTPTAVEAPTYVLNDVQSPLLQRWYQAVGVHEQDEPFGDLITRAARFQLGRRYVQREQKTAVEHLKITLDTFQCVSFVESTLAVARCTWNTDQTDACFLREVAASRYRGGQIDGYASRLHYFTDWIDDNVARRRLDMLSDDLGGTPIDADFNYMTKHPKRYPAMSTPEDKEQIAAIERRLSHSKPLVVDRAVVKRAQKSLSNGDLVAFVSSKPGLLVTHAGFVEIGDDGTPRVLHASSYHKRVLVSRQSVANYVLRKPERQGVMLARPKPPAEQASPASTETP